MFHTPSDYTTGCRFVDYSSYSSALTTDEMGSLNRRCAPRSTSVDFDSPFGLFYRQPSRTALAEGCSIAPVDQTTGKASDRYLGKCSLGKGRQSGLKIG